MGFPESLHRIYSRKALRGFKQYQIRFSAASREDGSLIHVYEYLVPAKAYDRAIALGGSEDEPEEIRRLREKEIAKSARRNLCDGC